MKFERLNAWLGLLGQLAVLGGLIALVVEIRGNTLSLRAQELATLEDRNSARQIALFDAELRGLYAKALFKPEELTVDEMIGVSNYLSYRVASLAGVYSRVQDGTLLESDWNESLQSVPIYLGSDIGRNWWQEARHDYVEDPGLLGFVEGIDEVLESSSVVPDDVFYARMCKRLEIRDCPVVEP